jgi:hypothetical protein
MANGDRIACPDDPSTMREQKVCLFAVSKDLKGKIGSPEAKASKCKEPACATLLTGQKLTLKVTAHPVCDTPESKPLDGDIEVEDFVHRFATDGRGRGFHSGRFRWKSGKTLIEGDLSGVSNGGLHREPPHKACQRCRAAGADEGTFCGTVIETDQSELKDAQVFGAYLLQFKRPTGDKGIPSGAANGTLEGVLIRPCK